MERIGNVCLCAFAVITASAAAGTIYDAGEALKANVVNGVNANPYTDSQGGQWSYLSSTALAGGDVSALSAGFVSTGNAALQGFQGAGGLPQILANTTGQDLFDNTGMAVGYSLGVNEVFMHPANDGAKYAVLRFTVPKAGWYSSLSTFRDMNKGGDPATRGAEVEVCINGVQQGIGVVAIEDVSAGDATTHSEDFQTPVRWLAAGDTIDFVVGPNGGHGWDATGVRASVREEEEGAFFDSGRAMKQNLAAEYSNPYSDPTNGTWTFYASTVTTNDYGLSLFDARSTVEPMFRGFNWSVAGIGLPAACVNEAETNIYSYPTTQPEWYRIMPGEVMMHPLYEYTNAVMRFQPTVSGYYSVSAVFRDVAVFNPMATSGVDIHLLIGGVDVTNTVITAEYWKQSAHFSYGPCLLVTGEPVDFVVGPNGLYSGDSTCVSAIVRHETNAVPVVHDAGTALIASVTNGTPANPFTASDGGAWAFGCKPSVTGAFTPYASHAESLYGYYTGWGYSGNDPNGLIPSIHANITGRALMNIFDSVGGHLVDGIFPLVANEISMHPYMEGYPTTYSTLRFLAPSNGLYRVKAHAHDISNGGAGGVKAWLLVGDNVIRSAVVSLESDGGHDTPIFRPDTLWLKEGETVDVVVDPHGGHAFDSTGVGLCVVCEGAGDDTHTINVDFNDPNGGKTLGAFTATGRIGFSGQTAWNALEIPGGATTAGTRDLYEADGISRRNVRASVKRANGELAGTRNSSLLTSWIQAADTNDVYTFTITGLTPAGSYALCLYSYAGTAAGDALFTVGGVTKGVSDWWFLTDAPVCTLFKNVAADEDGTITGTFTSGSATNGPAAFNGLQIVGKFPAYISPGVVITLE